jgi:tetratricopeptide (TPR) repeat protein
MGERMSTLTLILALFTLPLAFTRIYAWSWDSAETAMPSLRDDLDHEIATYRQQVLNGLNTHDRIIHLDRLIDNYKPMGVNVSELETERSRLILEEKQQQLRVSVAQDQATQLFDRGVSEYKEGQYQTALATFQEAERLIPNDTATKETRRRLSNIIPIMESETGTDRDAQLIRLAVTRSLENDPKRAFNALRYAEDKKLNRPEIPRLQRLIESDHPDAEPTAIPTGLTLVDHKLQLTLEAIYDGRYLSAISECTDILDLEPNNVMALTRLGSAYYAMNERDKAKQIWTKALQYDPNNEMLKKFLYSQKGASRVEVR